MLACALCAGLTGAAPEVPVNSRIGSAAGFWQAEPSIAVAGGTVVIGFNDTRYRDGYSGYAYSTDGGATWTDGSPLPRAGGGDRTLGDPALVACAGGFFYASLYFRPGFGSAVSISRGTVTQGQLVWDAPRIAASAIDIDPEGRNVLDKEYIACDPATGTLYVAYTRAVPGLTDGKERIEVVRSDTGGDTWSEPTAITSFSPRRRGKIAPMRARSCHNARSRTLTCGPQVQMSGSSQVEMSAFPSSWRDAWTSHIEHAGTGSPTGHDADRGAAALLREVRRVANVRRFGARPLRALIGAIFTAAQ
jgi:hypothetical protein